MLRTRGLASVKVGGPPAATIVGGSPARNPTASGREPAAVPGLKVGHFATGWPHPEQHNQHFCSLTFRELGACSHLPNGSETPVVDLMVLEWFVARLLLGMAEWVQCTIWRR